MRDKLAAVIVKHQPKPIPINTQEALVIADAILENFNVGEKNVEEDSTGTPT